MGAKKDFTLDAWNRRLERQREYRRENGNFYTLLYEKTKKGFLVRVYRNMKSRVTGVQKKSFHLYKGLCLLDRETFYTWSLDNKHFHDLFKRWEQCGYQRKLAPSVDRINSRDGYHLANMEWVTQSENSRRGSISKRRKNKWN